MARKITTDSTNVTNDTSPVVQMGGLMRLFELERSFLIFAIIYFPVTWLFLYRGVIEEAILGVYTFVMALIAAILLGKFVVHLGNSANDHDGKFGSLFTVYIFNAFTPLAMLKVFGYVANLILPADKHIGLMCDLVRLFRHLYFNIFQWQATLNYLILGSLTVMFIFALWSVRPHESK